MKIYFRDQHDNFYQHLTTLKSSPVAAFDRLSLKEVYSEIHVVNNRRLSDLDLSGIYKYDIFPPNILTHHTQWHGEGRKIQVGDTIVQQVFMPPLKSMSVKLVFGVRVNAIIEEQHKLGFNYVTLEGHVETGESQFLFEERNNAVYFSIRTFSVPGNFLTRMIGPIFTLPYQAYCTRQALQNVKRRLLMEN